MFSYKSDGSFVILTTSGDASTSERQSVFDAIRSDASVPDGAFLIVDVREIKAQLTQFEFRERVRALLDTLGPKLGTECAVIVSDPTMEVGLTFQSVAAMMDFRVGIFHDEYSARKWLIPYVTHLQGELQSD